MTSIADYVDRFVTDERPAGNLLDDAAILAQAIASANYYAGYADLETHLAIPIADPAPIPPTPYPAIDDLTEISVSEWAIIRPLFLLYIEREQALQLEASRGMGIDPFGRSSSEVAGDITQYELEIQHRAWFQPVRTV